ncbi:MAG: hypothetical protein GKS05_04820 [Nitrospirales bacterium]|nr:hypothetical protein [Nitrospirales bacterium]
MSAWAQELTDGIAAIVNSEVITVSELQAELEDETIRLQARFDGKDLTQRLVRKEYEVLNNLIARKLQIQEAKAKGLFITDAEVERAKSLINQRGANGVEVYSQEAIREELLLRKVQDFEVRRHVMVSKEEMRRHYQDFPEPFMKPARYHLRQILLAGPPGIDDSPSLSKAQDIYKELQDGASFSELAARYSDGPEAVRGGDLGAIAQTELLPTLAGVVAAMNPGDISQPIQTSLGIHILTLNAVDPPQAPPFKAIQEEIKNTLIQEKSKKIYDTWLAGLKEKAYIEIKF